MTGVPLDLYMFWKGLPNKTQALCVALCVHFIS